MEKKTAVKFTETIKFRERSSIKLNLVMEQLTCQLLEKPTKKTPPLPPPAYLKQKYKLFEFENVNASLDNAPIKPARSDLFVKQRLPLPSNESDTSGELKPEKTNKEDEFLLLEEMASQFTVQEREYLKEIDHLQ